MFQLPVSGLRVAFQQPTGWEDLLLQNQHDSRLTLFLMLVERLAQAAGGETVDWKGLPLADLDALLLLLRQVVVGDVVWSDTRCGNPQCGSHVDVSFRIGEYLASLIRRMPVWVEEDAESGWFRLTGQGARFRLPTGSDLAALEGDDGAERELLRQCMGASVVSTQLRRRMELAMEALAPSISRIVEGRCPECGGTMQIYFDVRSFVLHELRERAACIFQDVHLLALHYKWSEAEILGLPQKRRRYYAEMLRSQGAV
jgi:hypothetical protein